MGSELTAEEAQPARARLRDVIAAWGKPKVALALAMGLATGMPFVMTGVTLGYWLREEDLSLRAIGFLTWIALFFSLKFLWAPVVDRVSPPLFGRLLGRTRGWMALGQIGCIAGLAGMAFAGPTQNLPLFIGCAMAAAFFSATQDVAVDAWRIEIAEDHEQDVVASSYIFGLRGGYFLGDVGVLFGAALVGFPGAYGAAAAAGAIGLLAALWAAEPPARAAPERIGIAAALVAPVKAFFAAHGAAFPLIAVFISVYFIPDLLIGGMIGPFYVDLGYDRGEIAAVRTAFGITATLIGVTAAGVVGARLGSFSAVCLGVAMTSLSNLGLAAVATSGGAFPVWAGAVAAEGFSAGFATVAMVAWAGRLTSAGHTAAQFAILSSLMTLAGQLLRGVSGAAVEGLQAATGEAFLGYAAFFALSALSGAPILTLAYFVARARAASRSGATEVTATARRAMSAP